MRERIWRIAVSCGCAWFAWSCAGTPRVEPRLSSLEPHQLEVLIACYVGAGYVEKIVDLRDQGLSRDAILQHYRDTADERAVAVASEILPSIEADAPAPGTALDYAMQRYRGCVEPDLPLARDQDAAAFCFGLSQFAEVAKAYRKQGQPMDNAYRKVPVAADAKPITDSLLRRLAATPDDVAATKVQVDAYFECVGHPME